MFERDLMLAASCCYDLVEFNWAGQFERAIALDNVPSNGDDLVRCRRGPGLPTYYSCVGGRSPAPINYASSVAVRSRSPAAAHDNDYP